MQKTFALCYNLQMYIRVRVFAGMKKEFVRKVKENSFEISVKLPAKQNLANRRVMELMAREFKIPSGKVKMVSGYHSPGKILSVNCD